jgi:hypothetical protein
MSKIRPQALLKLDTKRSCSSSGTRKNSQQHQWDVANEVTKPGEKIEISAVHGRWLIVKMPARR